MSAEENECDPNLCSDFKSGNLSSRQLFVHAQWFQIRLGKVLWSICFGSALVPERLAFQFALDFCSARVGIYENALLRGTPRGGGRGRAWSFYPPPPCRAMAPKAPIVLSHA